MRIRKQKHKKVYNKKKNEDYKNCPEATKLENETNQLEKKIQLMWVFLEKIIKNLWNTVN